VQPSRYVLIQALAFSVTATAQVQLEFASPLFTLSNARYSTAVELPNGHTLLVGSSHPASAIGLSDSRPHAQIALTAIGSVPFQNGEPPDVLPVLGGSGNDEPQAATVDPRGNTWIIGNTDSDDFNQAIRVDR